MAGCIDVAKRAAAQQRVSVRSDRRRNPAVPEWIFCICVQCEKRVAFNRLSETYLGCLDELARDA